MSPFLYSPSHPDYTSEPTGEVSLFLTTHANMRHLMPSLQQACQNTSPQFDNLSLFYDNA